MSEKNRIRKEIKQSIAALGADEKQAKSQRVAERFLLLREYVSARSIFFYYSTSDEPDTHSLIAAAWADGKEVCISRIEGDKLCLVPYKEGDALRLNRYGIEEPVGESRELAPDLAVIPLLAFDRDKRRLGRGKGFYDRFLATFGGAVVALAFSEQEVSSVPAEPHDLSPSKIVTDREVIE